MVVRLGFFHDTRPGFSPSVSFVFEMKPFNKTNTSAHQESWRRAIERFCGFPQIVFDSSLIL